MSKIFISYRRNDSAGYAHAIYRELVQHFSRDRLFMDVDTVEPGVDFVHAIEKAVGECDVLVALMGKRWLGDEPGSTSRVDNEKDYVRLEISTALARGIRVIPVLVDGMTMPNENSLPSPVQPITRRNAIEISNTRFNYDVDQLITAVRKILDEAEIKRKVDEEKKRDRADQEALAHRTADKARFLEQERQWSEKEAKRNADQDNQKRIEEEADRARLQEEKARQRASLFRDKRFFYIGGAIIVGCLIFVITSFITDRSPVRETREALQVFRERLKSGGEGPEMLVIPAGLFQMGDLHGDGYEFEVPVRRISIQKPFAIGRYEVTFEEYDQFAEASGRQLPDDRGWGRGRRPVIQVSWQDAMEYIKWLSDQTGKRYRLPSEVEWEYAARAGKETAYWWGKDLLKGMANCNGCGSQWDAKQTAPVGSFKPNPFGMYDTAGNVWEWVEDCWHDNYTSAPADTSVWKEAGGGYCARRVIRGGSWIVRPGNMRSSLRYWFPAVDRTYDVGFRLAQDID